MVSEYYKTLIHALKLERNTIDKRIKTLEEWVNGKAYEPSTRSEITSKAMKESWAQRKEREARQNEEKKGGVHKGFKFNGKHWMQRPENRAKMMKAIKKMQKRNKEIRG